MIKEFKHLIKLQHTHTELIYLRYVRMKCYLKKYQSDNTNKIIVLQDFGGNTYSKNIKLFNNIKAIKESDNKSTDNLRFIIDSLLKPVNKISEIDVKIPQTDNKFTDNMRFMIDSSLKSVNKISEIDKKISQNDNKELDNEFTDNMRFMIYSLLKSLNKILVIDKKYH